MSQEIHTDLERAATYRFLALLFGPPSDELRDELKSLGWEVLDKKDGVEVKKIGG